MRGHPLSGHLCQDICVSHCVLARRQRQSYLVCQFRKVLLCVADDISHPEDGAVGVVDRVKVALFDVIVSDGRGEVPSRGAQGQGHVLSRR